MLDAVETRQLLVDVGAGLPPRLDRLHRPRGRFSAHGVSKDAWDAFCGDGVNSRAVHVPLCAYATDSADPNL